jgi:signal peptidase I
MNFDFALLLVVLTGVTGVLWLGDRLLLARARRRRAAALESMTSLPAAERKTRAEEALREPVVTEYARSFFPVLLLILLFRSFLAEPFKIPSGSMMPTLLIGDFILVNKFAYGLRLPVLNTKILSVGEPRRGDVFVFRYPKNPKEDYIKRVIGVPGDEITYRNKTLFVNGKEIPESYFGPYTGPTEPNNRMTGAQVRIENLEGVEHRIIELPNLQIGGEGTWKVPDGYYFAMGDNRDNSLDSRFWGFVPEANLVGKALVIWMNWDNGVDFGRIGTVIK